MHKINYREVARNLVARAIADYRKRFKQEINIVGGEDKKRILEEIDRIKENIDRDDREVLLAEIDMYKRQLESGKGEEFEL